MKADFDWVKDFIFRWNTVFDETTLVDPDCFNVEIHDLTDLPLSDLTGKMEIEESDDVVCFRGSELKGNFVLFPFF